MSTNIQYVETLTPEKRQSIIKNSVMTMPNSVVNNPTELKKAFVKPIVNDDGTPCIANIIDEIAVAINEHLNSIFTQIAVSSTEIANMKVRYGRGIYLDLNEKNYVLSIGLLNDLGDIIPNSTKIIDLPLESVVVGGSFDEETSEIVLVLKNGNEIRFPVSNIVGGFISDKEFEDFLATKGQPNGFAGLDANGKVPKEQLPACSGGDGISAAEFEELLIESLTNPTEEWTDEERVAACETIGAVAKPTDTSGFNRVYGIINGTTDAIYYNLFAPLQFSSEQDAKRRDGVAYYSGGRLGCAPPERDYETANKKYVDDLTAELRAGIVQDVIESGKGEIVQAIIEELQGLPVFGVVDENNTITITSQLSSGTYTLKYENADGTTTKIGTIVIGSGEPEGGNTYEVDIASIGYTDNARWSITDGTIRTGASGYTAINKIPFARTSKQTVSITLSGITWTDSASSTQYAAILLYSGDSYTSGNNMYMKKIPANYDELGLIGKLNDDGTITFTITNGTKGIMFDGFKLCGYGIGANAKVTITIE